MKGNNNTRFASSTIIIQLCCPCTPDWPPRKQATSTPWGWSCHQQQCWTRSQCTHCAILAVWQALQLQQQVQSYDRKGFPAFGFRQTAEELLSGCHGMKNWKRLISRSWKHLSTVEEHRAQWDGSCWARLGVPKPSACAAHFPGMPALACVRMLVTLPWQPAWKSHSLTFRKQRDCDINAHLGTA